MTFRLGLTGSIGMGKSTTAAMFAEEGVPVWDADAAVHRLYATGGAAAKLLAKVMPDVIKDGAVSRDLIKAAIARDPSVLSKIEGYVHPLVAADRTSFADRSEEPIILFESPLLFETGADVGMDAVVVVSAPPAVQKERVLARPGMTEAQFEMILARQMRDSEKRARADYVIETVSMDATRAAVRDVLTKIRGKLSDA